MLLAVSSLLPAILILGLFVLTELTSNHLALITTIVLRLLNCCQVTGLSIFLSGFQVQGG